VRQGQDHKYQDRGLRSRLPITEQILQKRTKHVSLD